MAADAYLHGFDAQEQARLASQGAYLAPWIYDGLPLPSGRLLEIGAGVGAQTHQLLQRSSARVFAVERERKQLEAWRRTIPRNEPACALAGDGRRLPLRDGCMDGAFICWVLEHVPRAEELLIEAHRVLAPGASIAIVEVQNQSLAVWPRAQAIYRYWDAVNTTQQEMGGDPFVGVRLGQMLAQAGFAEVEVEWVPIHADARDVPRRNGIFDYFHELLQSAAASVQAAHRDWPGTREELAAEFAALRANPVSAFLYTFARATARKGR
jgi:SAM-dependent methyltransferase